MQNISFIGLGRLGLCTALCLEKHGYNILGLELHQDYVDSINNKTLQSNEPHVNDLLKESKNLTATTDFNKILDFSDIIFILVATPTKNDNSYDCTVLNQILIKINDNKVHNKHIVINCTVEPTYIDKIAKNLIKDCENTFISYNPEFIAQGSIINGLLYPDFILIGEGSQESGDILESIYKKMTPNVKIHRMSQASAEITKLAINCFITMKISYANMISDISDSTINADKNDILNAIGEDSRIGKKCLNSGYGFGGPCFPRDNRALGSYAEKIKINDCIQKSTDNYNKFHCDFMVEQYLQQNLDEYIFEDVAYKSKCPVDIIEESQKLEVAKKIAESGKKVVIKDRDSIIHLVKEKYGTLFNY